MGRAALGSKSLGCFHKAMGSPGPKAATKGVLCPQGMAGSSFPGWRVSHRKQRGDSFVNHRSVSQLLLLLLVADPSPKGHSLVGRSSGQHIPPPSPNNSSLDPVSLLLFENFEEEGEGNKLFFLHLAAGSWGP